MKRPPARFLRTLDGVILRHVHAVLAREGGNISRAAQCLGISRNTLKR